MAERLCNNDEAADRGGYDVKARCLIWRRVALMAARRALKISEAGHVKTSSQ